MTGQPWFINFEPRAGAQMRLFCFAHAGGSASVFRDFATGLPDGIDVWAVNLPGHGSRMGEAPLLNLRLLADDVARALLDLSERGPFAFFGHSLGARLAFEAARSLRRWGKALPAHLFAAACPAPQLPSQRAWHNLPDDDLVQELIAHNGLPQALLAEPAVLALFLPALRADLTLYETAVYEPERPFAFAITAMGGSRDRLASVKEIEAWREQSTGPFKLLLYDGDHFFPYKKQTEVIADCGFMIADL